MGRVAKQQRPGVAAPPARRMRRAAIGDLRLWLGIGLLAVSAAVGAVVLSSDEATVTVWRAARDLSAGSRPAELEPVAVAAEVAAVGYLRPGDPTDGVLRWPVQAGELVPASAVAPLQVEPTREVTVPVDPLHAPVDLQIGDLVDVWSTAGDPGADGSSDPRQVLGSVAVAAVAVDEMGLGGEVGVVLDVPVDDVLALVGAARGGVLDLVAVPAASQAVLP